MNIHEKENKWECPHGTVSCHEFSRCTVCTAHLKLCVRCDSILASRAILEQQHYPGDYNRHPRLYDPAGEKAKAKQKEQRDKLIELAQCWLSAYTNAGNGWCFDKATHSDNLENLKIAEKAFRDYVEHMQ